MKKHWTRRLSSLLLALLLVLLPAGCGGQLLSPEPPAGPAGQPDPAPAPLEQPSLEEEQPPIETEEPGEAAQPDDPEDAENPEEPSPEDTGKSRQEEPALSEDGWYSSKEEVALYLHLYGHLPDNFVTKKQAQQAGWTGGNVERYTGEGTALGGGKFGNYEELLPKAPGRTYQECDIDTVGASSRGAKRIVFSNDGLIYYTEDHYESFELLYGEP